MSRTDVRRRRIAVRPRRRFARTLVVSAVAVSGLGFLAGHATAVTSHPAAAHHRVYVVRPGDTLWSIALRVAGPGADPRPVVDRLTSLNHVRDAAITPGERLVLPAASA